jgi:hypothetical protein
MDRPLVNIKKMVVFFNIELRYRSTEDLIGKKDLYLGFK